LALGKPPQRDLDGVALRATGRREGQTRGDPDRVGRALSARAPAADDVVRPLRCRGDLEGLAAASGDRSDKCGDALGTGTVPVDADAIARPELCAGNRDGL